MRYICLLIVIVIYLPRCLGDDSVNGWDYKYDVFAAGMRSQQPYGKLFYKGMELPKEFDHVITCIGEFVFIDRGNITIISTGKSEKIGWLPAGRYPNGETRAGYGREDIEDLLSGRDPDCRRVIMKERPEATSSRSFMAGTFEHPSDGVGPDWFFVVDKGVWVNPDKMDEALKALFPASK